METEYLEIKFAIHTQEQGNGRFTVPIDVCRLLNLNREDLIHLVIHRANGEALAPMEKKLSSGTEIYGEGISGVLDNHERIIIIASHPKPL